MKKFGYDASLTSTIKDGNLVEIPKEMLLFYTRPFAEFDILDKKIQQKVSKQNLTIKYKVGIIVTKTGKLQLSLNGNRLTLRDYKSEKSNTYRAARALYDANGEPLTRSGLNLKANSKTQLKGLIKNMRITGILEELFIEYGSNNTVCLKHHVLATEREYDSLLQYVKTLNLKNE